MALRRVSGGPPAARSTVVAGLLLLALVIAPARADASVFGGLGKIISGVLAVPEGLVTGTLHGPPIVGTIVGTVMGALNGVKLITFGTLETAASAVPLALKLLPFLPLAL